MSGQEYMVPSVVAAASLLGELVHAPGGGLSQAELTRLAGLSRSSGHNLLGTLTGLGYITRDTETRKYELGPALIQLGRAASERFRVLARAETQAESLSAQLHIQVAVVRQTSSVDAEVVSAAAPTRSVYVAAQLGTRLDHTMGAVGRCLLATLPDDEIERVLRERPIPPRTPTAITESDAVLERVHATRLRGFDYAVSEVWEINAACAPIIAGPGEPQLFLLALAFSGQVTPAELPALGARLREAADQVVAEGAVNAPDGDRFQLDD